ncbi:MBL fold metallo-hydrolase [Rhodococcus gannanensis]|uniref:MBL fold metallo-hydrolase n=1 Tax=Rhodococcus gannanensis TaxID=1960308 RepID=A0ABW4P773_9NOCA
MHRNTTRRNGVYLATAVAAAVLLATGSSGIGSAQSVDLGSGSASGSGEQIVTSPAIGPLVDSAIRQQLTGSQPDPSFAADDGRVRVLTCGTGSPELSEASQACTMVAAGGRMLLFDVGEGATRSLNSSKVDLANIDHVFLTHFHSDHVNGLGSFVNQRWNWGATTPLQVVGPPGVDQVVDGLNSAYALDIGYRTADMAGLADEVAAATATPVPAPIPAGESSVRVYDDGGVTVDALAVAHEPVEPAYGYVVTYRDKKVFISGDTMVTPKTLPAMQDADLVVHEAYATHMVERAVPIMRELGLDADVAERTGHYHADTVALAEQAQQAGVDHLVLTHLIPYADTAIERQLFVAGMSDRFDGEITVAQDGSLFVL